MGAISDYLENKLLDHVLRVAAYSQPSALYLALYTLDPTDADTGTEVSGGSYARQTITFGAASGGQSKNNANVEFPQATANWGTITHIGIRDASTGGNLLFYGPLTSSVTINSGEIMRFQANSITITLD
jgi:hypothetical protein